jgi:hypothetical protein
VTGINLLLNGIPLTNRKNVVADAQPNNEWTQESLNKALHSFSIKYCCSTPALLNRIEELNRFLPFLPGNRLKFESDDIREMLYKALLPYEQNIVSTSNYKWEDTRKSDIQVNS